MGFFLLLVQSVALYEFRVSKIRMFVANINNDSVSSGHKSFMVQLTLRWEVEHKCCCTPGKARKAVLLLTDHAVIG